MRCDPSIHAAYKAAREGSPKKRWLLGELYKHNFGLTKILLDQVLGFRTTSQGKNLNNRMSVPGAGIVDWDEGMGFASIAFIKAVDGFDAGEGSFSMFLKRKIYYEIQVAVMKSGAVTMRRLLKGQEPPGIHHFNDDEEMAQILEETRDEPREEDEDPEPDSTRPLLTAPSTPKPPRPDTRSALEVLLADHLVFGRHARSPAIPIRETYASIAYRRVELADQHSLTRELAARGVRRITMRVPWWPRPVGGLAGVGLQSDSPLR